MQLLRVDEVEQAVTGHPDPLGIPDRNIARLNELGREEIERLWVDWSGE